MINPKEGEEDKWSLSKILTQTIGEKRFFEKINQEKSAEINFTYPVAEVLYQKPCSFSWFNLSSIDQNFKPETGLSSAVHFKFI